MSLASAELVSMWFRPALSTPCPLPLSWSPGVGLVLTESPSLGLATTTGLLLWLAVPSFLTVQIERMPPPPEAPCSSRAHGGTGLSGRSPL